MKKKTFKRITYKERVIIENRYCVDFKSKKAIAKELKRPTTTISREIAGKPHKGNGKYRADVAQRVVDVKRKNQGRTGKMLHNPLREYVVEKLKLGWSPEQIDLRLPIDYPDNKKMRISFEAIYQYIYSQVNRQGYGFVKKGCEDLRQYLPRRHKRRTPKGFRKAQKLAREAVLPSIEDRPPVVESRARVGDWEDDFVVSRTGTSQIKSINERKTGIIFFGKTVGCTAKDGDIVVREKMEQVPKKYRKTLTRDRGPENMCHESLSEDLSIDIFFAHAYSSWERGSNENGNGLFRRFFPKKTNFDMISNERIDYVEYLINSRPRKRFGGYTPYEVFYQETGVALEG